MLKKVAESLSINQIKPENYVAVYFVSGKGAMFDFPDNHYVQSHSKIITGQNPWPVWKLAETVILNLGYPLQSRMKTVEENSDRYSLDIC